MLFQIFLFILSKRRPLTSWRMFRFCRKWSVKAFHVVWWYNFLALLRTSLRWWTLTPECLRKGFDSCFLWQSAFWSLLVSEKVKEVFPLISWLRLTSPRLHWRAVILFCTREQTKLLSPLLYELRLHPEISDYCLPNHLRLGLLLACPLFSLACHAVVDHNFCHPQCFWVAVFFAL